MKSVILKVVARGIIISNLSIAYTDSTVFLTNLYGFNLTSIGMLLFLLSFYAIVFIKKTNSLSLSENPIRWVFYLLKALVFLISFAPLLLDKDWNVLNYGSADHPVGKALFEIIKLVGIELIIDLGVWLEKSYTPKV